MSEGDEADTSPIISIPESVTEVAYAVSSLASNVSSSVGDVVGSFSSVIGVGEAVHNVTSGVVRMMTSPPQTLFDDFQYNEDDESPGVGAPTPRIEGFPKPSPSSESLESCTSGGESRQNIEVMIDFEIGVDENYFSKPEGSELDMNKDDLQESIKRCKNLILDCEGNSCRRRALVHKLIQLRLCLQRVEEEEELKVFGIQMIMGHQLAPQKPPFAKSSKQHCDTCAQIIWGIIHVSYLCKLCSFVSHGRCLKRIQRKCASVRLEESPVYITKICPEIGLSKQNYRCAECASIITNKNAWAEPRRCDYTGKYYCPACHWNSRVVIPARVIHNWDFEDRVVSRQAKQLLMLMINKPLLDINLLNPSLYRFVEEFTTLKKMRTEILLMKKYLITCRIAQENKLLLQLESKQHFIDCADIFSLQDLIDINSGRLVDFVDKIHSCYLSHIKIHCLICSGKGYICEICKSNTPIFPFDPDVTTCQICSSACHTPCFQKLEDECPKCTRQKLRKLKISEQYEL